MSEKVLVDREQLERAASVIAWMSCRSDIKAADLKRLEQCASELSCALTAPVAQAEPVATVLPPDPLDERSGSWLTLEDWERLQALPAGTRLYAAPLAAQPAVGEEIMVNAAHDVFTLPLQPSGLSSGPRFVVHVPGPEPQPAASTEPVAWVAADTLNSPHPTCISSLAYMSQLDRERGREYVPLYAALIERIDAALKQQSEDAV